MTQELLALAELLQPAHGGATKAGFSLLDALLHTARPAKDDDRFTSGLDIVPRNTTESDPFPILF
jgi:hypothetical protein